MGNNNSAGRAFAPQKLSHCLDDNGDLNPDSFCLYRRAKKRRTREALEEIIEKCVAAANEEIAVEVATKQRTRSVKAHGVLVRNEDGSTRAMQPKETFWYNNYVASEPLTTRDRTVFRKRFRLPYAEFLEVLSMVEECELFYRWQSTDAVGRPSSPLPLLVLGALRYLGRGWTFDDLNEATAIMCLSF